MNIWDFIAPKENSGGFSPKENWGEPFKLNGFLLLTMYALRIYTGWPIIINNAYALSGHSVGSQHYVGNAADWHFKTIVPFVEQVSKVINFLSDFQIHNRTGLGIYPVWKHPGFHLDVRGYYARWGWTGLYTEHGTRKYVSFAEALQYAKENNI